MARAGGNPLCVGNKNSGRKSKLEEVQVVLAECKEKITQEALIKLANNKVFQLLQTCATIEEVKSLGLPITLKGMTDKVEHSGLVNITGINYINPDGNNTKANEEATPSV